MREIAYPAFFACWLGGIWYLEKLLLQPFRHFADCLRRRLSYWVQHYGTIIRCLYHTIAAQCCNRAEYYPYPSRLTGATGGSEEVRDRLERNQAGTMHYDTVVFMGALERSSKAAGPCKYVAVLYCRTNTTSYCFTTDNVASPALSSRIFCTRLPSLCANQGCR